MNKEEFNTGLLEFLDASPTAFHATQNMLNSLLEAGFQQLKESETWNIEANGSYVVTRNDSSIIAFRTGTSPASEQGWRMVGAHTDSPCLKVKPNPNLLSQGVSQLGVEIYGGVLLAPWFDRDLSLAGRVTFRNSDGELTSRLVNFKKSIASVPSLAIHLDRQANENRSINKQKEMNLVLGTEIDSFDKLLASRLNEEYEDLGDIRVLDWEILAYDTQPAALTGFKGEYISSARLDNLLSCYIGLKGLLLNGSDQPTLLVCNDHEEVGSQSACGAAGPFLRDVLERLEGTDHLSQTLSKSLLISADNAHAIHPNFADKHDGKHGPRINSGPVIKVNANQRYATNSETSAVFRSLCEQADVPVQTFVTRNDMGCGSTIGPITSGELGVATIDIGCPQWAMHSIRETVGSEDPLMLFKVLTSFYNYEKPLIFDS